MKEVYIAHLKTDQEFIDFFMVKSIELKIGSKNSTLIFCWETKPATSTPRNGTFQTRRPRTSEASLREMLLKSRHR